MVKRMRWLGLLLPWLLFVAVISVNAQTPSGATLFPPDTESFPTIKTYLDVHAEDGSFVHGLQAADLRILEDNRPVPVVEFSELRSGVQVVFAINPGDSFTIRDSQGLSRYDYIYNTLDNWAVTREGSTVDDLSLIVTSGPARTHTANPGELISALDAYQIDAALPNPSLDTLLQALDVALDAPPRAGMERAIMFITSPLQGDLTSGLQDVIIRAQNERVRIYVWYIAAPDLPVTPAARQMQDLAEQTDGEFFTISAVDQLPSPEIFLNKLRDIYMLSYETQISSGDPHQLVVEIQNGDEQIVTPVLEYNLNLQPPDPTFISPVSEIIRQESEGTRNSVWEQASAADLLPKEHELLILVDFPDGRNRPLALTRLFVDGEFVAENTKQPFDRFIWDISVYTTTARHLLQVEALDSLGLSAISIETPVEVVVELPGANPLVILARKAPLAIGLLVLLSGAVALLVLIVSGKIRPHSLRVPAGFRYARRKEAKNDTVPDTSDDQAALRAETDGRRFSGWVSRLNWPQRRLAPQAYAFLIPILEAESTALGTPISIDSSEITLGNDKSQAVLVFDDPSLDGLHARLIRQEDGTFLLCDQGSVSGTWINYSAVPLEGKPVHHGDLIHIGRVGFQFKLRKPQQVRKPVSIHAESGM